MTGAYSEFSSRRRGAGRRVGGGQAQQPTKYLFFDFDFFSLQMILQKGSNCLIEKKLKFSRGPIFFQRGWGHIAISYM